MRNQGAEVDNYCGGERLITASSEPVFGGVYKLAAIKNKDGKFIPKIKLSETTEKVTNPGDKTIYRVYEKETGKIKADLICLVDDVMDESQPLLLFDPIEPWKKTLMQPGTYTLREMLVPIFLKGECVYESPDIEEIKASNRRDFRFWYESPLIYQGALFAFLGRI